MKAKVNVLAKPIFFLSRISMLVETAATSPVRWSMVGVKYLGLRNVSNNSTLLSCITKSVIFLQSSSLLVKFIFHVDNPIYSSLHRLSLWF